jgi:hypothetical protein
LRKKPAARMLSRSSLAVRGWRRAAPWGVKKERSLASSWASVASCRRHLACARERCGVGGVYCAGRARSRSVCGACVRGAGVGRVRWSTHEPRGGGGMRGGEAGGAPSPETLSSHPAAPGPVRARCCPRRRREARRCGWARRDDGRSRELGAEMRQTVGRLGDRDLTSPRARRTSRRARARSRERYRSPSRGIGGKRFSDSQRKHSCFSASAGMRRARARSRSRSARSRKR